MNPFIESFTPIGAVAGDGTFYPASTVADLRKAGVAEAAILAGVKAHLGGAIDAEAERLRLTAITPGAGQAMEYQQAQVEAFDALAVAAAGKPIDPAAYPMLAATVGLDKDPQTGAAAVDVLGVARSVKAAFAFWLTFGAAIKAARVSGKAAVDAADTVPAAAAAAAAIGWPSRS